MEISESEFDEILNEKTEDSFINCLNVENLSIWYDKYQTCCEKIDYLSTPIKIDKQDIYNFTCENRKIIDEFKLRQKDILLENKVCVSVEDYDIYDGMKTNFLVFTLEVADEEEYFTLYNTSNGYYNRLVIYKLDDKYFRHYL